MVEQEAAILAKEGDKAYDKILIGGFSQGAILTLGTLMRYYERFDSPLGGFVALSGLVPNKPTDDEAACHPFSAAP